MIYDRFSNVVCFNWCPNWRGCGYDYYSENGVKQGGKFMLKKIFLNQSKTITSAAIIIGATSLLSRILGIFRDRVLASEFGASRELDIYYAAFRIPDLVFNLLILGALSAGFIPVFSQYLNQPKKAWRLVNIILNLIFIFLVLLSGLLFFLAPWLTKIIPPGFV